jgi:hypothetical protein
MLISYASGEEWAPAWCPQTEARNFVANAQTQLSDWQSVPGRYFSHASGHRQRSPASASCLPRRRAQLTSLTSIQSKLGGRIAVNSGDQVSIPAAKARGIDAAVQTQTYTDRTARHLSVVKSTGAAEARGTHLSCKLFPAKRDLNLSTAA